MEPQHSSGPRESGEGNAAHIEADLREAEARQRFLLQLSDALRPLSDAVAIEETASRLLGEHLGVSRALYGECHVEGGQGYVVIARDYCAPGIASLAGRVPAAGLGPAMPDLRAGRVIQACDTEIESTTEGERAAWRALGVRAYVGFPLLKVGRLAVAFGVHQSQPRTWTPGEIALIGDTAERTWDAVERARAEAALHAIEAQLDRQRRLYESVLTTTPDLAYIFDLDHRFIYANEGLLKMWGKSRDEAIGKNCRELGYPEWHAAMHDREIERVIATRQPVRGVVPFDGAFGRRLYDYIFTPVTNAQGDVEAVAGTTRDVTDLKDAEEALAASDARNRQILDSAADYAIIATDIDGKVTRWNTGAERLLGWTEDEMRGHAIERIFTPEDLAAGQVGHEMQRARGRGHGTDERWHVRKGGERFWASGEMMPLLDDADAVVGFVKVVRDRTEHRRAEQQRELMIHELNHRVKNTLATVQALAAQTFRGAGAEQALDTFEERLIALSRAHDVLTREQWQGAAITEIVHNALAAWADGDNPRFRVHGAELRVRPRAALALAMALHELLTNAAKYGALSNDAGTIDIDWSVTGDPPARFGLRWQERDGPPVRVPERRGFGSRLIEQGLAGDLGATVELSFDPAGVACRIEAPLDEVREAPTAP